MGRLTHRKENGEAAVWLYADPEKPAEVCREQLRKEKAVLEKLAYYEDLEEAGRIIILPKKLINEMAEAMLESGTCPSHYELKGSDDCENCYCVDCWEMALRGVK